MDSFQSTNTTTDLIDCDEISYFASDEYLEESLMNGNPFDFDLDFAESVPRLDTGTEQIFTSSVVTPENKRKLPLTFSNHAPFPNPEPVESSFRQEKTKSVRPSYEVPMEQRTYFDCYDPELDVLCGRGGESNSNPANNRFRVEALRLNKTRYSKLNRKQHAAEMRAITFELVNFVVSRRGRFLQKETDEEKISELKLLLDSPSDKWWYEIDPLKARQKCSQAIREAPQKPKRPRQSRSHR